MNSRMTKDEVVEKLGFAERRLRELLTLNDGHFAGADQAERQQLLQEFFFHLVGATEVLAQLVNEVRGLNIPYEYVDVSKVAGKLQAGDPIKPTLASLHVNTRGAQLTSDPYSDEGYIFRILIYRHHVTHRRRKPFHFRVGSTPSASLLLDPRDPEGPHPGPSEKSVQDELRYMFDLIEARCGEIMSSL